MILNKIETIGNISSTRKKEGRLREVASDDLLKKVLYLMLSRRVKFYIQSIPEYGTCSHGHQQISLSDALDMLEPISSREVTGNKAKEHLAYILSSVNEHDAEIIKRIIKKDAKIGMGAKSINKVIKGLVEITPYMGAVSYDKKKVERLIATGHAVSQTKMDGRYANVLIHHDGSVEIESRQGEPTYVHGPVIKAFDNSLVKGIVLNGEITMRGDIDRYTANGIVASIVSIRKKEAQGSNTDKEKAKFEKSNGMTIEEAEGLIVYSVWDAITLDEYFDNASSRPYEERYDVACDAVATIDHPSIQMVEYIPVISFGEAMRDFQDKIKAGEEGTILKSLKGTWKNGKPVWQIKMKLNMTVDMKIIGFNDGTEGTKNEGSIGSLKCASSDDIVFADPSGIKDDERDMFNADRESFIGKIVEVKCCGLSEDANGNKSLLHPSFVRIRDDKSVADSYQDMVENENMVKGLT